MRYLDVHIPGESRTNNDPTHDYELIPKVDPKWRNECLIICYPKWGFSYLRTRTIFCNEAEFVVLNNLDPIYHFNIRFMKAGNKILTP